MKNTIVHTVSIKGTTFTENKCKFKGCRLKSEKNVNETESRLLFLDKSIHCNANQKGDC